MGERPPSVTHSTTQEPSHESQPGQGVPGSRHRRFAWHRRRHRTCPRGEGADVALSYVASPDKAKALVRELQGKGVRAVAFQADRANASQVTQLVRKVVDHFGHLDILVNNAGVFMTGPVSEVDATRWTGNSRSTCRRRGSPRAKPQSDNWRSSSRSARCASSSPWPGIADYSASKAAVAAYTRGWARDLGPKGITVNVIQPGPIDTEMNPADGACRSQKSGSGSTLRPPEEIGATVAFPGKLYAAFITGAHRRRRRIQRLISIQQENVMKIGIIGAIGIAQAVASRRFEQVRSGPQQQARAGNVAGVGRDARGGGESRRRARRRARTSSCSQCNGRTSRRRSPVCPTGLGRILIDATNPTDGPPQFKLAELGGKTSSQVVASLAPGARREDALNTLTVANLSADPREAGGRRVLFMSGDDAPAKKESRSPRSAWGFATIDLGSLAIGGAPQQFPGGPLPVHNLIKLG